jgi:membrane protein implicated in regulation of membrane protease activity
MKRPLFDFSEPGRVVRTILAHLSVLLSVMVLTWFVIDRFNTAMEFMSADISKWYIAVLAALSLASSIITIVKLWRRPDEGDRPDEKDGDID